MGLIICGTYNFSFTRAKWFSFNHVFKEPWDIRNRYTGAPPPASNPVSAIKYNVNPSDQGDHAIFR